MDQGTEQRLEALKTEHRQLDERISALSAESSSIGHLELARLKKRKLMLKDQIQIIIDQSTPDIIA